jgi:hypothetical protein
VFTDKVIDNKAITPKMQKTITDQLVAAFRSWIQFGKECNGKNANELVEDAYVVDIILLPMGVPEPITVRLCIEPPELLEPPDKGNADWWKTGGSPS